MSDTPPSRPPEKPVSGLALFFSVFPSIVLPLMMAIMDMTLVATAVPSIVSSLGGLELGPWVIVVYLMAATVSAPVYGLLGDTFGRLRLMRIGICIFMLGALLSMLAPTMETLLAARVLQGLGAGGLSALSHALIGEVLPARERARYQGFISITNGAAASLGPVIGSFLVVAFDWRAVFFIYLPLSVLALLMTLRLTHRAGTGRAARFDLVGLVLFTLTVVAMLTLFDRIRKAGDAQFLELLLHGAAAAAALTVLVWWEKRVAQPVVPIHLIRDPVIGRCDILAGVFGGTQVALVTVLPIYLLVVEGLPLKEVGILMLAQTVGAATGSASTGYAMGRTGRIALFPSIGLSVCTLSFLFFAFTLRWFDPVVLMLLLGLNAVFLGMIMPVLQISVQHAAGPGHLASAAASVQIFRNIGAAAGTAIASAVMFFMLRQGGPDVLPVFSMLLEGAASAPATARIDAAMPAIDNAFTAVFLCFALFTACGAVAAWTMPLRRL